MNWLQPLLAVVQEQLENTDLGGHTQMREPLWKSRFPEEKLWHSIGAKKQKFGHTGVAVSKDWRAWDEAVT